MDVIIINCYIVAARLNRVGGPVEIAETDSAVMCANHDAVLQSLAVVRCKGIAGLRGGVDCTILYCTIVSTYRQRGCICGVCYKAAAAYFYIRPINNEA